MRNYQNKSLGCFMILVVIFLPPLALVIKWKGFIPLLVTTICTCLFWVLGSISAVIYLGD